MKIAGRNNILGSIPQDRGKYYDGDDIDLLMEETKAKSKTRRIILAIRKIVASN